MGEWEKRDEPGMEPQPASDQQPNREVDVALTHLTASKRSPAFQWYPESWFGSSKVSRMGHTEKGMYIDLLGFAWLERGLPNDINKIASMLKLPAKRFQRIWDGPLGECFIERNGRLYNPRQEAERQKQKEHKQRKSDAANARWGQERNVRAYADTMQTPNSGHADAMPSISVSVSDPISKKKEEVDSSPPVLSFPVTGDPTRTMWILTQGQVDRWNEAYPHLDVLGECRKALAWVEANQPKTARGMPAFLNRWLGTAANRPASGRGVPSWVVR